MEAAVSAALRRAGLLVLAAYAAIFALLGVDTAVRVWLARASFEARLDVGILIVYEGMRVTTVIVAVLVATVLGWRGVRRPAAVLASALLLLLAIGFAKATSYAGFPGLIQERVAVGLIGAGVPRPLLAFLFGQPAWAFGLAAAAFLRLAVTYPTDLTADAVGAADLNGRAGMLRGRALAGADVGALARSASAAAVRAGMLRPAPVWTVATILALAHAAGDAILSTVAMALAIGLPVLLGVPALRAGFAAADAANRARILWFVEAMLVAGVALVLAAILSAVPAGALGWLSFAILAVAPMIVLLCLATAIVPAGGVEPARALRFTVQWGGASVLAVLVAAVVETVLQPMLAALPALRATVALLAAAAVVSPAATLLRTRGARGWPFRAPVADR
jgi:hypothetical protein